jgi:hypothetical protein
MTDSSSFYNSCNYHVKVCMYTEFQYVTVQYVYGEAISPKLLWILEVH